MTEFVFRFGGIEGIVTRSTHTTNGHIERICIVRNEVANTRTHSTLFGPFRYGHFKTMHQLAIGLSSFLRLNSLRSARLNKLILTRTNYVEDSPEAMRAQKFTTFKGNDCSFRYFDATVRFKNNCQASKVASFFRKWSDQAETLYNYNYGNYNYGRSIFASPCLKEVNLVIGRFADSDVLKLLEVNNYYRSILASPYLKEVSLDIGQTALADSVLKFLGGSLSTKIVSLRMRPAKGTRLVPLARLLQDNKYLRVLDLNGAFLFPDDVEAFMTLLAKHNSTLQKIEGSFDYMGNMNVIEQRHTLLDRKEENTADNKYCRRAERINKYYRRVERMNFFLKLNRYGRKRNATASFLAKTIIEHKEETAVVFFYLSKNPHILAQVASQR